MDEEKIIDEVLDFVEQYTEITDIRLSIKNEEVNIDVEVISSNFNYMNVAKMLSHILKSRYSTYKFIVNLVPISSKINPLLKDFGVRPEIMKKIHNLSFDEAFADFITKPEFNEESIELLFFKKPFKVPVFIDEFISEKEVCYDYIDFLNESASYLGKDNFVKEPKAIESMIRFNLLRLYGSKLFRMGTIYLVKLWRFSYDLILQNSSVKFSTIISDKDKFSNFLNTLDLKTYENDFIKSSLEKDEIKYYHLPNDVFVEMLVGGAIYLEAAATSIVQNLILFNPSKFYNYFLKRFSNMLSDDKFTIAYYLTLGGGVAFDELEFTQIKGSPLGRFKINRSEIKVSYDGNKKVYLNALNKAYRRLSKKIGGGFL
jgi:hypothetical protein